MFQQFSGGKPTGDYELFGTGFAGPNPNQAQFRPDGVAQAPDGSLFIADSNKGKIWRVMYKK